MKIIVLILSLYISSSLFSNVELLINNYHPYKGEVTSLIVSGPYNRESNYFELGIDEKDFEVIKSKEIVSDNRIKFMLKIIFKTPGQMVLTPILNGFTGRSKVIEVEELNLDSGLPSSRVLLPKEWAFAGEVILYKIDLFSDNFISDVQFRQAPMDNSKIILDQGVNKNIHFEDGTIGKVKRVITYGLYSDTQGVFQIPPGVLNYGNKSVDVPSIEFEIFRLPKGVKSNFLIGETGNISINGLRDRYHFNSKIEFTVKVYGNINLDELNSLKSYSPDLGNYKETITRYDRKVVQEFIYQEKIFKYSGVVTNLTGIKTPTINIPHYNTKSYNIESINIEGFKSMGSFSTLFLIITQIIVVGLIAYMILITIKWIKSNKHDSKVSIESYFEKYDLSNREQDIFRLLIPGKSNKEIATDLNISPETVKKHIQNILKKSQKSSRIELIAEISPNILKKEP